MEPVHYCVKPGANVTFQWIKKDYNVISLPKDNYTNCDIEDKTAENSPYIFMPNKSGTAYFASGVRDQCEHGTKATIFSDDNCTCNSAHEPQDAWNTDHARITHDLKLLMDDWKLNKTLNFTDLMDDVFALKLVLLSETQGEVLQNAKPCSTIRRDCFKCFVALTDACLGCLFHKSFEIIKERISATNASCYSCICQITKTCIKSQTCPEVERVIVQNNETSHPCSENRSNCPSPPMTCVFNLTMESLYSDVDGRRADGRNRTVLAYNGQIPGPPIVICEGDELVINFKNGLTGNGDDVDDTTTLHIHGIREINRPWSDGVPWVTQCPILPGENFTYGFNATNSFGVSPGTYTQPGTYWYHSHVGSQRTDGAYGVLIIMPNMTKEDDNFDVDDTKNTIIIQEWYESPTNQTIRSLLINGNGRVGKDDFITNYTVYNINEPGQRYQFRVVGAISQNVPLRLSIDEHMFSAIATDSQNIEPVHNLTDLWVAAGETYHIVVQTSNITDYSLGIAYKIRVFGYENPSGPWKKRGPYCTIAWLKYPKQTVNHTYVTDNECTGFDLEYPRRTLNPVPNNFTQWEERLKTNSTAQHSMTGNIFINQLRALKIKPSLAMKNDKMLLNTHYIELVGVTFNNISMIYPKIPFLLQQPSHGECGSVCNFTVIPTTNVTVAEKTRYITTNCSTKMPERCTVGEHCQCQHVLKLPFAHGYWAEIVLINNDVNSTAHPIHMHGGWFWVMGMEKFNHSINRTFIKKREKKKLVPRNFDLPPAKDVIQVPPGGYVILRYSTDNAGDWLLHCHINEHVLAGMAMVLQMGGFREKKQLLQERCTGPLPINTKCKTPPPGRAPDPAPVSCCGVKIVTGMGPLDDKYTLVKEGPDKPNDVCKDGCIYKRDSHPGDEYCFKDQETSGSIMCEASSGETLGTTISQLNN